MWHFDTASWYYATVYEPSHQPREIFPRAEVAQLAEHSPEKAGVDSSILSLGTTLRILADSSRLNGASVSI